MTNLRKADPEARRRALRVVAVGGVVGTLLIRGLERYLAPLRDGLLSEPGKRSSG